MTHPNSTTKPKVTLITDGACSGNPGPGGWAVVFRSANGTERAKVGGEYATTNNRMELTALLEGLRGLKKPCEVTVITDSKYVADGFTQWLPGWVKNGWRTSGKKAVVNQDLWEAILQAAAPHDLTFQWVKGHAGHSDNERVDRLAVSGIPNSK